MFSSKCNTPINKKDVKDDLLLKCIPHPHPKSEFGGVSFQYNGTDKPSVILKASKKRQQPILCIVTSSPLYHPVKSSSSESTPYDRVALHQINIKKFAKSVLSHPLIIEAIEDLFVSVCFSWEECIGGGPEEHCFKKLIAGSVGDNYFLPTIAILGSQGEDIVSKSSTSMEYLTVGRFCTVMIKSLLFFHQSELNPVPRYLKHLERQERVFDNKSGGKAFFAMSNAHVGEAEFAECIGVIACKAALFGEKELVLVIYDEKLVSYSEIVRFAIGRGKTDIIYYVNDEEKEVANYQVINKSCTNKSDFEVARLTGSIGGSIQVRTANYYISLTTFQFIPMTQYTMCRVNHALFQKDRDDAFSLLSPRQGALLQYLRRNSDIPKSSIVDLDIYEGWTVALNKSVVERTRSANGHDRK